MSEGEPAYDFVDEPGFPYLVIRHEDDLDQFEDAYAGVTVLILESMTVVTRLDDEWVTVSGLEPE